MLDNWCRIDVRCLNKKYRTAHWSIKMMIWPSLLQRTLHCLCKTLADWSMALLQWFKVVSDQKWLNDSHNTNILKLILSFFTLLEYILLSRVSKCSSSNVITNEAYLLFFELSSWPKRWSFERLVAAVILRAFVINRILEIFSTSRILWYPPERYPQHFKFRESEKPLLQQSSNATTLRSQVPR